MLRTVRALGSVTLLLALFEACSSNEATPPTPPAGPALITIKSISLGNGTYDESNPPTQVLSCDYTIGVNVLLTNWKLYPPGLCAGAPQCGQLRVSLLDESSPDPVIQVLAAGNGVALDVAALVDKSNLTAWKPPLTGNFTIRAELVDDSGKPYVEVDGGDGSDTTGNLDVKLPSGCNAPSGGGGSAGGEATGGSAGMGGEEAVAGMSGAAGDQAIGGNSGSGGSSGTAGSNGGSSGTAGSTGGDQATGGSSGTAGSTAGSTAGGA